MIRKSALPQVENLLHIEPDWGLETEEKQEGLVLVRLQRRSPAGGGHDPAA